MVTTRRSYSCFGVVATSGAITLAVLCDAPGAAAQSLDVRPMLPGAGMVLTHVSAGQRSFAVFFGRSPHPIADCEQECDFWAWPGKYRILVRQGEGPNDSVSVALRIRHSGSYAFAPANGGAQNAGLILGVSGPAIGFVGLVFTAAGLLATCSNPPPGKTCATPVSLYVGVTALAVGVGMTAVGWPLYIYNRARFDVTATPPTRPRAVWGLVPMAHGGLGLGATFAF